MNFNFHIAVFLVVTFSLLVGYTEYRWGYAPPVPTTGLYSVITERAKIGGRNAVRLQSPGHHQSD